MDKLPSLKGKVITGGRLNAARALEDDRLAPSALSQAKGEADWEKMRVSWVNSADDGSLGAPATFNELRWTDVDGRKMTHRLAAGEPGSPSEVEIPVLPSSSQATLKLSLHAVDNAANVSEATELQLQQPAAAVSNLQWETEGSWGKTEVPGRGAVWADSPGGNYSHKSTSSLTSKPFKLEGTSSRLSFETRYRLEPLSDGVELEVREVGSEDWTTLDSYTSYREWRRESVDLSSFDGKTVQIRFRLHSDAVKNDEGIYLDRICVAGRKN